MRHLPTTVLLDLAEDYQELAKLNSIPARRDGAKCILAEIDTELLSRMPEFSYVTVLDDGGNPIGFEPYIGEDNEYLAFERQAYEQARLDDDLGW